ncbi:MAG: hypothetical protein V2I48_02845 [Xanthomonadales bacterium]|jgi:hypothetical protein|nr:hypothetical protein [Xanthomonadales bacterium]
MKHRQIGYVDRRTLLLVALLAILAVFAVPKINSYKDKVSEAYELTVE